jgi:hypothetical protein
MQQEKILHLGTQTPGTRHGEIKMTRSASFILALCLGLTTAASATAQQSRAESNAAIPHLIRFGGVLKDIDGKPAQGTVRVTFAFYKEEQGGQPLWTETQKVTFDASGRYSVMLGATMSDGLPQTLFQAGDAWWIETRVAGAEDDEGTRTFAAATPARSLLAAVPYALKSVDSETLAGRSAADYVTREDLHAAVASGVQAAAQATPMGGPTAVTGAGATGYLPVWTGSANLGDSALFESSNKVGVNTATPASTLDVNGTTNLRGVVTLPPANDATPAAGVNSPALKFGASSYSSTSAAALAQNFVWQAVSSGNNTSRPTANLELLFGGGGAVATPTGFQIAPNGQITFAAGQKFPGIGNGTITGVTAGSGLSGGGTSGTVTLSLNTGFADGRYARLGASNTFSGVQVINNYVGIGISSPLYPLHVDGTIRSENGGLSLGGFAPLSVDAYGIPGGRLAVLSNGMVGIDNANPQATLDVGGNINASGSLSSNGLTVNAGGASVNGPLTINGDLPMTAAPHMYLTGFVPGPLGAYTATQAIFTIPSKNILITRLTSSGLNTCPGNGPLTFSVFTSNGGFLFDMNLSSTPQSVSDSGPISIPIAAGTQLFGLINTPDCGSFGTAPANIPVSIEYVMQ